MPEHTKTPWRKSGGLIVTEHPAEIGIVRGLHNIGQPMDDNLDFIVTACNCHEELLYQLRTLETAARRFVEGKDNRHQYVLAVCEKVRTLIKNAGRQPC